MDHITGTPREQITLFPDAIEDYINDENLIRFIDAFVDTLDLATLGFQKVQLADTGTPPYWPGDLLKLYLYGYLNRVRSSRRLERETHRNVEVMWLLKKLTPDHKTISDFRKDNPTAIRGVCRQFVVLCQTMDLFGGDLVAVDGSKFRASNSKKRNFTTKKLKERLQQIDASIGEYLKTLETNDQQEAPLPLHDAQALQQKIATLNERRQHYETLLQQLEDSGETQVSLSDPDARQMVGGGKAEISYNVQTVVDQKHKLIVEHDVTNDINDRYQLAPMAQRAKETLGTETLEVLADKGYATPTEIKKCEDQGIVPYVPIPETTEKRKTNIPTPDYYHSQFHYDKERDVYLCPQHQELTLLHKTWHREHWTTVYGTPACRECPVKNQCTINKRGRRIYRSEHEEVMERLRERISQNPEKLAKRKCLSEHPFGTLKHGWNQGYFLLRGLPKVRTEASLSVLAYNIRRAITVLGVPALVQHLFFSG
ncbi:MAG: IS1182 family transposase [Candidatus Eisenbacteria bacterium]|nr:IS1182 family transposase [Candidatus Eisenbacteria bacterium]